MNDPVHGCTSTHDAMCIGESGRYPTLSPARLFMPHSAKLFAMAVDRFTPRQLRARRIVLQSHLLTGFIAKLKMIWDSMRNAQPPGEAH